MLILNEHNTVIETDTIRKDCHYSTLSFKDHKYPDFVFPHLTQIEEFTAAAIVLEIGTFEVVMPLHWAILCSDHEFVQTIPLDEISGRDFFVFCINPIDGYIPEYLPLRTKSIYPDVSWSSPYIEDKDMLVTPLGVNPRHKVEEASRGPICAIFSPKRIDVTRQISDII